MPASEHEANLERLKAKVSAADDLDEKFYFVQRAAGDALAANAPGLIARLQEAGAISAAEAASLFGRLLSAASVPPEAAAAAPAAAQPPRPQPMPGLPPPAQAQEQVPDAPLQARVPTASPSALSAQAMSVPVPGNAPAAAAAAAAAAASAEGSEAAALEDREVLARAVQLGMDVRADRSLLWLAAEALKAPLPAGWQVRHDVLGTPYYLEEATQQSRREPPTNESYRARFFALKRERVGYRELMLSRVTSTHLCDALAALPEAEAQRLEALFEQHDRDQDGVVSYGEFALLADEAAVRQGAKPFPPAKLRSIFVAADLNADGGVDFNEFCRAQMKSTSKRRSSSRRSSPTPSLTASRAGSQAGDDTPRSWPNATPRQWPTPPMTPRDPLDSPSTMSVASTHSMYSYAGSRAGSQAGDDTPRSHYDAHYDAQAPDSRGSGGGRGDAFAEVLSGLLGPLGPPSVSRSSAPSFSGRSGASDGPSGGSDDVSPGGCGGCGGGGSALSFATMWPVPLLADNSGASSQYVGSASPPYVSGGGGRGSAGGGSLRDSPMTATRPTPPLPLTATMALPPSSRAGSEAAGSGGEAAEAVWGRLRLEGGGSDAAGVPPVSLLRGAEHVIGRSKVCKLVLQSSRISGQHAAFFVTAGALLLEDRSRYGTFHNGNLIGKGGSVPVHHGDRISLLAPAPPDGVLFRLEITDPRALDRVVGTGTGRAGAAPPSARAGMETSFRGPPPAVRGTSLEEPPMSCRMSSAASVAETEAPTEVGWRQPSLATAPPGAPPASQYVVTPAASCLTTRPMTAPPPLLQPPSAAAIAAAAAAMPPTPIPPRLPPAGPPPGCAWGHAPPLPQRMASPMGPPMAPLMAPPMAPAHMGMGCAPLSFAINLTAAATRLPPPSATATSAYADASQIGYAGSFAGLRHEGAGAVLGAEADRGSSGDGYGYMAGSYTEHSHGGVSTGIGAPNATRDLSRDEPFLQIQRLQVEAIAEAAASERESASKRSSNPVSRLMRSMSFKLGRSPAKSPRAKGLDAARSPRSLASSTPGSPDASPRSNASHPASPRLPSPRLSSSRMIQDLDSVPTAAVPTIVPTIVPTTGATIGATMGTMRQPIWDRAAAGALVTLPPELLGSSPVGSLPVGSSPVGAGEAGGAGSSGSAGEGAEGFDAAYERAADVATLSLMDRATARGEKFRPNVTRADFVTAVHLMATQLGLALEPPQIEQLFDAVSAGGRTVQFDDFVEAPSTRYYLLQLGRVEQDGAPGRRAKGVEPHLEA
jgi:hypothetical protein